MGILGLFMVCSQMYLHRFALRGRGAVLAGVAQWIERRPVNQGVAGLIPSQGTCLGCRPVPGGGSGEATTHYCFSPCLSPSFPL